MLLLLFVIMFLQLNGNCKQFPATSSLTLWLYALPASYIYTQAATMRRVYAKSQRYGLLTDGKSALG